MNLFRAISVTFFLCFIGSTPLHADDGGAIEVGRLIYQGKLDEAQRYLNDALKAHPSNPQLQFMQGVIQLERNDIERALVHFHKMTVDYPHFAEPYNNLAVIYAKRGQLEKARASLELAISNMPDYATAYENLALIYAKLAQENRKKAARLGANTQQSNGAAVSVVVKN